MQKRIISLIAGLVLLMGLTAQAVAPDADAVTVVPANQDITVTATITTEEPAGDEAVEEAAQPEEPAYGFRVDGVLYPDMRTQVWHETTYVSIRDFAQALRPGIYVGWNGTNAIVWADDLSITAVPGQVYIEANGRYLYVPDGVKVFNGAVMVPVKVLAKAMGAQVSWSPETGVAVTSGSGTITSAAEFYDAEDLNYLSRIIFAESGNQPLSGKIAVGNVILNRVESSLFPDTVYGVIYQRNQFTPVANGSINKTPSAESILAAKLCLDGAVVLEDVLFFNRAGINCWAARNRAYVTTIADHAFYA